MKQTFALAGVILIVLGIFFVIWDTAIMPNLWPPKPTLTPTPVPKSSNANSTVVAVPSTTPESRLSYLIPTVSPLLPTPTPEAQPNNPSEYDLTHLEHMLRLGFRKFDIYILSGDDLPAVDDYIQAQAEEFPDADIVVSVTCDWPETGSWTEEGRFVIRYQFKAVCKRWQTD